MANRLPEVAALLNPAFTGLVLSHAVDSYLGESGRPMPWPVAFLVLPLVLHEETRENLPRSVRKKFLVWATEHAEIRLGFPRRAQALTEVTREAIRFALRNGALMVDSLGLRTITKPRTVSKSQSGDLLACAKAADFCGRWVALTDPITTFLILGVRP